ncbi:MAG TPA: hypothetical protein PKG66_10255, partial [Methanothrix sp.]|nr:hypothetical protein [Methanothrix sp.]
PMDLHRGIYLPMWLDNPQEGFQPPIRTNTDRDDSIRHLQDETIPLLSIISQILPGCLEWKKLGEIRIDPELIGTLDHPVMEMGPGCRKDDYLSHTRTGCQITLEFPVQ